MNTFSTPRLWTRTLTTNALISVEGLASGRAVIRRWRCAECRPDMDSLLMYRA
jgi:hypothetical protein